MKNQQLRKIEFFIPEDKYETVEKLITKENFTRAELMRRALDNFIDEYEDKKGKL